MSQLFLNRRNNVIKQSKSFPLHVSVPEQQKRITFLLWAKYCLFPLFFFFCYLNWNIKDLFILFSRILSWDGSFGLLRWPCYALNISSKHSQAVHDLHDVHEAVSSAPLCNSACTFFYCTYTFCSWTSFTWIPKFLVAFNSNIAVWMFLNHEWIYKLVQYREMSCLC